eukprot:gene4638-6519_t
MFSNIFNDKTNNNKNADIYLPDLLVDNNMPSWEDLNLMLRNYEPIDERVDFDSIKTGRSKTNSKALIRLFDAPDGFKPEITLYRDTAAWCPYCEKVWLQLEEKRIPYQIIKIPLRCYGSKPRSFFQINPSGGLPVAEIKGSIMAESNDIMFKIESEFPDYKPLMPKRDSAEYTRANSLFKVERQAFSVWFGWLTSGSAASQQMDNVLKIVDMELSKTNGPYFMGDEISLVDIMFTPFLERMAASLPYYKGFESRSSNYPFLLKWYEAMDTRPAYQGIKSDYYTHCHDLPPQIGGCVSLPGSEKYSSLIDGDDWSVEKDSNVLFEPMIPFDAMVAKREVVRNIIGNHDAIVKFCTRAVSKTRIGETVSAPLCDPGLQPNDSYIPYVDAAMRYTIHLLLLSSINYENDSKTNINYNPPIIPNAIRSDIQSCLLYLRDRVGVPRDMSIHAAKQLRSYLNMYITNHLMI